MSIVEFLPVSATMSLGHCSALQWCHWVTKITSPPPSSTSAPSRRICAVRPLPVSWSYTCSSSTSSSSSSIWGRSWWTLCQWACHSRGARSTLTPPCAPPSRTCRARVLALVHWGADHAARPPDILSLHVARWCHGVTDFTELLQSHNLVTKIWMYYSAAGVVKATPPTSTPASSTDERSCNATVLNSYLRLRVNVLGLRLWLSSVWNSD